MNRKHVASVSALCCALALTACGGKGKSSDTGGSVAEAAGARRRSRPAPA